MNRQPVRRIAIALLIGAGVSLAAAASGRGQAQAPPEQKPKAKADPKINAPFHKADVEEYIKRFERESRENYAQRHEIVEAVGLEPGMAVADVGAGTGLFTRLFAEKVGVTGKVYAVDISKPFLDHIAREARKRGLKQISVVRGSQDSINLPANSVDVVFLSDVYHHLENPQKSLASIHRALRPDGRLVIVEFDRVEGKSSDFVLKHIRASQAVFRKEIEEAGFRVIPTKHPPKLKENFFLRFEKLERGESQSE